MARIAGKQRIADPGAAVVRWAPRHGIPESLKCRAAMLYALYGTWAQVARELNIPAGALYAAKARLKGGLDDLEQMADYYRREFLRDEGDRLKSQLRRTALKTLAKCEDAVDSPKYRPGTGVWRELSEMVRTIRLVDGQSTDNVDLGTMLGRVLGEFSKLSPDDRRRVLADVAAKERAA